MKIRTLCFVITLFMSSVVYPQKYNINVHSNGNKISLPIQNIVMIKFADIPVDTPAKVLDKKYMSNLVKTFVLFQNYPNPFNPTTIIKYSIPKSGTIEIKIFDITGRLVNKFIFVNQSSDEHSMIWDGKNSFGLRVASGTYICQVEFERSVLEKRMILIK